jgi:hypothetical protein
MDTLKLTENPAFLNKLKYATPMDRYIVGVDLGKSVDSTAIAVLHHTRTPTKQWVDNLTKGYSKQKADERFHVVHLERLPLGMAYPMQIEYVRRLLERAPLDGVAPCVCDDTGVGKAVSDGMVLAGIRPLYRVTITAGAEVTQHAGNCWHVPKFVLISTLESRMHTQELKVAPRLVEAGPLREEMLDFERNVSEAGRQTFSARVGKHDDILLAVSLATFWAVHTGQKAESSMPLSDAFASGMIKRFAA